MTPIFDALLAEELGQRIARAEQDRYPAMIVRETDLAAVTVQRHFQVLLAHEFDPAVFGVK